jgi:hypothetical protein
MPRYTACYDAYLCFVVPKSVSEYLLEEYDATTLTKRVIGKKLRASLNRI